MKDFTIINNKNIHALVSTVTQVVYASDDDAGFFYPIERNYIFENLIESPDTYRFRKISNLHFFIYCIEDTLIYHGAREDCKNACFSDSEYQNLIDNYGVIYEAFTPGCINWIAASGKDIDEADEYDILDYYYYLEKEGIYQTILDKLANEAFHILFTNRKFLFEFNKLLSSYLSSRGREALSDEIISKIKIPGGVRRTLVPKWAERAVYFRDRGRCMGCNKDLSGTLSLHNKQQIDHIIPLEKYGMNCVTNLQLMCDKCNLKKGTKIIEPSSKYESWY